MISPKDKPTLAKAKPKGKLRAEGKKTITFDKGANCNWLMEALRRAGYTLLS